MILPESAVRQFFEFIVERHAVYVRRERGDKWPWTNDNILQTYKFTNIFRELDTGTVHCRVAIREPYADHKELFFNIASYRLYNYVDTQKELGFLTDYSVAKVLKKMYARRERGDKVFTGAHMISGTLGGDKIHQVFELCLAQLWYNRRALEPQLGDTLEQAFQRLCGKNPGYGGFIAYEVITDLRHTRYLEDAADIMTWANAGPGCKRGINRILGNNVSNRRKGAPKVDTSNYPKKDEYLKYMRELLAMSVDYLPGWVPFMEMRDIEHSLCEYDKYMRVCTGEGRPRSKFVPPHERSIS